MEVRQSRFDLRPAFDGETFDEERDGARLSRQLRLVRDAMASGGWFTLAQLARRVEASETSVSARLRDLRKPRYGAHTIELQYAGQGVWLYRMVP